MLRPSSVLFRLVLFLGLVAPLGVGPQEARAQNQLFLVNDSTTVREITFKFLGTQTFDAGTLVEQMALQEPGFLDKVRDWFDWIPLVGGPPVYPFEPVALARDVVRLRKFYERNGFLQPRIDYAQSQYRRDGNSIHIIITVEEGPPLIIQDVGFFAPDSAYATGLFEPPLDRRWGRFRDDVTLRAGQRFTQFDYVRIQDQILAWMRDNGFAFATVRAESDVDTAYNSVDLRYYLNPGPLGTVGAIEIEGNESVAAKVVRRELPFKVGDRYSWGEVTDGQRELFNLNLFRVALAELPEQAEDSSVTVRYRLRETELRRIEAQTGYSERGGLQVLGQWSHRNFLGGARNLTISLTGETGILAARDRNAIIPREFGGAVQVRQPFLFTTQLSASIGPFLYYVANPFFEEDPDAILGINSRRTGVRTELTYELLPLRTVTLEHTFEQATVTQPANDTLQSNIRQDITRDPFSKNIFSLSARLGRVDDFFQPSRGYIVRPLAEVAPSLFGSQIQYYKLSNEVLGYFPLDGQFTLAARILGGRIFPLADSRAQDTQPYENRFDNIRFYAGGANDVRGWGPQDIGPTTIFADSIAFDPDLAACSGERADVDCWTVLNPYAEPVGGLAKWAANVELRMPFPGLGPKWRTAAFVDMGRVSDTALLSLNDLRIGVGGGLRYQTPVGFIRLDIGYKVNPSDGELSSLTRRYLAQEEGLDVLNPSFLDRFRIHFSLGQSF